MAEKESFRGGGYNPFGYSAIVDAEGVEERKSGKEGTTKDRKLPRVPRGGTGRITLSPKKKST